MNDSGTLWESYKTTEQRAGPLPMASTPRTPRSIRGPETPNVTNIIVDTTEQDENIDFLNANLSIRVNCQNCKSLEAEVRELRDKVEKQAAMIKSLLKSLNSTSEMDSSESQVGNGSTASTAKSSTRVQRVTPTKRETTTSTSSSSTSSSSTPVVRPVVRHILDQLTPTPRSPRSPRTPIQQSMARNVRPASLTRAVASRSPQIPVTPTASRRSRAGPLPRTPQSLPMGTMQSRRSGNSALPPPPIQSVPSRRSQSRRRLFANDPTVDLTQYPRGRNENPIEHLNISPVKDDQWSQACPPRLHLERNRPEFIERLEARQSIIRAASEKRAQIEQRKRNAARAVATGQRSVESVSRDLFADSTAVRAFFEEDMREITMKNIRKSKSYQKEVWNRMANMDKVANRIIAQTHSLRARSTSRPRHPY